MTSNAIEAKVRRKAHRMGLRLTKSRRLDPDAVDFGKFALHDISTGGVIHPQGPISPHDLTLEEVEEFLAGV